jgi:hypothetical protein
MAIKLPAQRKAAQPRHAMCRRCAARLIISANSSVGCHPRLHADAAARLGPCGALLDKPAVAPGATKLL